MFDDLRERSASPFDDDENEETPTAFDDGFNDFDDDDRPGREMPIFGLTALQRFVLTLMLFLNVFVLGCFCLLATGRIVPVQ